MLTSAVMIQTFKMPVTDTATTVSSVVRGGRQKIKPTVIKISVNSAQYAGFDVLVQVSYLHISMTHGRINIKPNSADSNNIK